MNERARWRHRRLLYSAIVSMIIGAGVLVGYYRVAAWASEYFAVTSYVVVAQQLDTQTVTELSEWLDNKMAEGSLRKPVCPVLTFELMNAFPLVGSVSWSRYNPVCLTCTVSGVRPALVVNEHFVAGTNGRLYSDAVLPVDRTQVPSVVISSEWVAQDHFSRPFTFFMNVAPAILQSYDCVYHNPSMVVMTPKTTLDLPYRCVCIVDERSVTLLPDMVELMSMCQHRDGHISLLDFRFSGRIVNKCITHKECKNLQRV